MITSELQAALTALLDARCLMEDNASRVVPNDQATLRQVYALVIHAAAPVASVLSIAQAFQESH